MTPVENGDKPAGAETLTLKMARTDAGEKYWWIAFENVDALKGKKYLVKVTKNATTGRLVLAFGANTTQEQLDEIGEAINGLEDLYFDPTPTTDPADIAAWNGKGSGGSNDQDGEPVVKVPLDQFVPDTVNATSFTYNYYSQHT